MPRKDDEDTKARAVRLVVDHEEDYASEWEAVKAADPASGWSTRAVPRGVLEERYPAELRVVRGRPLDCGQAWLSGVATPLRLYRGDRT